MTIEVMPEIGVPMPPDISYMDLRERVSAACNTAVHLRDHGLKVEATDEDLDVAGTLVGAYAQDAEKTSKKATTKRVAKMRPASLILVDDLLQEFGQSVVENAVQIRHLVTNKLLTETENPDARIRLRALELLGKLSDVGAFSEKSEITITHRSTQELKDSLRSKLAKVINPDEEIVEGEIVDLGKELSI